MTGSGATIFRNAFLFGSFVTYMDLSKQIVPGGLSPFMTGIKYNYRRLLQHFISSVNLYCGHLSLCPLSRNDFLSSPLFFSTLIPLLFFILLFSLFLYFRSCLQQPCLADYMASRCRQISSTHTTAFVTSIYYHFVYMLMCLHFLCGSTCTCKCICRRVLHV